MSQYIFKRNHRQFRIGDAVPDTYGEGVIQTMLAHHQIEPRPAKAAPERAGAFAPAANKVMEPAGVATKGAA